MRGKAHSDELRAEVAAALLAGMSLSDTARRYNLSPSVVSRIRDSISSDALERVGKENEVRIDRILADSLKSHILFQQAVTNICSNENYLRSQTAADIARLLEVSQNHSIRLLEAASMAGVETTEQDETTDTAAVS
jgi:transposase-like protein